MTKIVYLWALAITKSDKIVDFLNTAQSVTCSAAYGAMAWSKGEAFIQCAWFKLNVCKQIFKPSGHVSLPANFDVHMHVFINKQHPAMWVFALRRGANFDTTEFSSKSFQRARKNCDTSSFQWAMTRNKLLICQCQLWDAPYLFFFPCLTSSSSFFFAFE